MRSSLGRWLLVLLIAWPLFAGVSVSVDKKEVTKGDTVTFTITAQGNNVTFPVVKEIDGFPILATVQRSNIAMVNGHVTKSVSKSYTFAPMKDIEIPPFSVTVDGRTFKTDPVPIHVGDAPPPITAQTKGGSTLTIELEKKRLYVGEPTVMRVTLRYPADQNIAQADLPSPQFENFWIKKVGETQRKREGNMVVVTSRYLLFPQKAGHFELGPLSTKIAKRVRVKPPIDDPFFNDDFFNGFFAQLQWRRIASNTVALDVKPLPGNVELFGRFDITARVDKSTVSADKPVTLTLRIEGEGNIEDIRKFEPEVGGAIVYADEPKIEEWIKNGRYGGRFIQTITFVAENDFTIPSFSIRYYDPIAQKVVEKKTDPIVIHVIGAQASQTSQKRVAHSDTNVSEGSIERETTISKQTVSNGPTAQSHNIYVIMIAFLFGVAFGAGGVMAWKKLDRRIELSFTNDPPRRILLAKSDRELFDLLLPYAKKHKKIEEAVEKLESNLYDRTHHRLDRKELAAIVAQIEQNH